MPLICVVGLPRSGTTMLARTLTAGSNVRYHEEPNPMWRFRNWRKLGHEQFEPEHATNRVRSHIRKILLQDGASGDDRVIIEKTPANCLRIGFVERVVPEVRFLFIRRDPIAIRGSMLRKWISGTDRNAARLSDDIVFRELRGKLAKFRYVHPSEAALYIRTEIALRGEKRRLGRSAFWGPQMCGWRELAGEPPEDVVGQGLLSHGDLVAERYRGCQAPHAVIDYEDLVQAPANRIRGALGKIGCDGLDVSTGLKSFHGKVE